LLLVIASWRPIKANLAGGLILVIAMLWMLALYKVAADQNFADGKPLRMRLRPRLCTNVRQIRDTWTVMAICNMLPTWDRRSS
jgi:hypothetical protein